VKIELRFCWWDFWVGGYWARNKKVLYLAPLPMFIIRISR